MNTRKRKAARRLALNLTGEFGNKTQAIAIRQLREWVKDMPPGDMMTLRCECALSDKQFRVWKKWFERHEDPGWHIDENFKSFWFYKPI